MNRGDYAQYMVEKITPLKEALARDFQTPGRIKSFVVDDLLPPDLAKAISEQFPKTKDLKFLNTIREQKYVTSQMNKYSKTSEEIVNAFQDTRLVKLIGEITNIPEIYPDELLYAAGISAMSQGCFLKPHLDNSHDYKGRRFRVINLLYYVSESWEEKYGGNLELWDEGAKKPCRTIFSKFNRLVVMGTYKKSWHSVSPVVHDGVRQCVSSYYFSPTSIEGERYTHVTSFRGRPEDKMVGRLLDADRLLLNAIGKVIRFFTRGNIPTSHLYKK